MNRSAIFRIPINGNLVLLSGLSFKLDIMLDISGVYFGSLAQLSVNFLGKALVFCIGVHIILISLYATKLHIYADIAISR